MPDRKMRLNRTDRAREAFAAADDSHALETRYPVSPLLVWWDPGRWLTMEYLQVEIRIEQGEAYIHATRQVYRDEVLRQETVNGTIGQDQYLAAVQQMQQMMAAMLLPWAPFFAPFVRRR